MKFSFVFFCLTCCSIFSCKSVSVQQESFHKTVQQKPLGLVGEYKDFLLEEDYNALSIPNYINPIKLNANQISFNTTSFRAFEAARKVQNSKVKIHYVDSLELKPKFIKLQVADRLALINSLNHKGNNEVFQYIEFKDSAHIITAVTIAVNDLESNILLSADELFLETSGIKNYSIKAYNNGEFIDEVEFNSGVVFAFQTSSACWKQNGKYQLEIVDLVEKNDKCTNKSYKNANHAKKRINYFKL